MSAAKMMWVLLASNMYHSLIVPVSVWETLGYFQGNLQDFYSFFVIEYENIPTYAL